MWDRPFGQLFLSRLLLNVHISAFGSEPLWCCEASSALFLTPWGCGGVGRVTLADLVVSGCVVLEGLEGSFSDLQL